MEMEMRRRFGDPVFINSLVLAAVAIPHLIDDFLYDIPAEFGLTNIQTQILAGVFTVAFVGAIGLAAQGHRSGYIGTMFWGGFLALAGVLKHIPLMLKPGPYWSGFFSEFLILVMILSGVSLSYFSLRSLRELNRVE
jgi:hypothetical protein